MFIEPTITQVPSGFSGYIWLDKKIVLIKKLFSNLYAAVTCKMNLTKVRKCKHHAIPSIAYPGEGTYLFTVGLAC